MTESLFILFTLLLTFNTLEVQDHNYRLHISEDRNILKKVLNDAIDVRLVHHGHIDSTGDASVCTIR